tara:strand:- start:610 stop:885 length:276 start_codon:yes stop_codon:yes gene_type:complete
MPKITTIPNEVKMENNKSQKAETQKATIEKAKALMQRFYDKAENQEHDDLVELTLTIMDLQGRVYSLEDKLQDLIDNLRIIMVKDEEENGK